MAEYNGEWMTWTQAEGEMAFKVYDGLGPEDGITKADLMKADQISMKIMEKMGGGGMQWCWDSSECRGPEFEGGCCVIGEFTEGDPDRMDRETRMFYDNTKDGNGACAPRQIAEFFDDLDGEEVNFYDYQEYLFSEFPGMYS